MSEMSSLLTDLGDENAMLKKVLAEKEIEATILRELLEKVKRK
jgi:hypothetical protein